MKRNMTKNVEMNLKLNRLVGWWVLLTLFQTPSVMMVFDRLLTNILCDGLELPNL